MEDRMSRAAKVSGVLLVIILAALLLFMVCGCSSSKRQTVHIQESSVTKETLTAKDTISVSETAFLEWLKESDLVVEWTTTTIPMVLDTANQVVSTKTETHGRIKLTEIQTSSADISSEETGSSVAHVEATRNEEKETESIDIKEKDYLGWFIISFFIFTLVLIGTRLR